MQFKMENKQKEEEEKTPFDDINIDNFQGFNDDVFKNPKTEFSQK